MHSFREVGQHHVIECSAYASLFRLLQLSGKDWNLIGIQAQVVAEVVVYLLEAAAPKVVIGVGFTLMDQHSFDYAGFLRNLCHLDYPLIRIHTVGLGHIYQPAPAWVCGLHCQIIGTGILVPKFQFCTGNGHVYYAHPVLCRELLDHFPAKEIYRTHIVAFTADRRDCRVPVPFCTVQGRHIHRSHKTEPGVVEP